MPKKKTSLQAKHLRQSKKRTLRNMSIKSAVNTAVTSARASTGDSPAEAAAVVRQAQKVLDKAASKGTIHKRTAARKSSRLARNLNKALKGASSSED